MSDSSKKGFGIQEIQEASFHQKEKLICLKAWKIRKKLHKPQEQQRIKRIVLKFEEWEKERGEKEITKEGAVKQEALILTEKNTILNSLFGLRI